MVRYLVQIEGQEYEIEVEYRSDRFFVTCNGKRFEIERYSLSDSRVLVLIDKESLEVDVHSRWGNGQRSVLVAGIETHGTIEDYTLARLRKASGSLAGPLIDSCLKAPMPGMVIEIRVKPGERVVKDQPLIVIEAMKMENIIRSKGETVVKSVIAARGKSIEKGDILLEFE